MAKELTYSQKEVEAMRRAVEAYDGFNRGEAWQCKSIHDGNWKDCYAGQSWCSDDFEFRKKPEPTYRTFTLDELKQKIGWLLKGKFDGALYLATGFHPEDGLVIDGSAWLGEEILELWTHANGSPFGALVD